MSEEICSYGDGRGEIVTGIAALKTELDIQRDALRTVAPRSALDSENLAVARQILDDAAQQVAKALAWRCIFLRRDWVCRGCARIKSAERSS